MARSLPSRIGKQAGRAVGAAAKGTLTLGSATFNRMFPTIGRLMGGPRNLFDSRQPIAAASASLVRNNASLGAIYDNINEQNRLLENILNSYKYGAAPTMPAAAPGAGGGAGGGGTGGGMDIDPIIPEFERGRPRPTPQQRPSATRETPRQRPRSWIRRFLTFMKRKSPRLFKATARRIAAAAAGVAVPGPGWFLTLISAASFAFLAYDIYQVYKEFQEAEQSGNEQEEDENILSNLPSQEEEEAAEREIRQEAERQLFGDVSQMGVQEGEETEAERNVRLQQAAQSERRRQSAGLTENLDDPTRQRLMTALAAAEAQLRRADTPVNRNRVNELRAQLQRHNATRPISEADASRSAPTTPTRSREEIINERLAARNAELQGQLISAMAQANAQETTMMSTGSIGASMDAEMSLVSQAMQRSSDAIRVEGDTIIYDFERIKFEAQKIKFEGLSLPSQQTAAPMMQESAVPQMAMASASPASAATSIGAPPAVGMQPIQVNNQAMVTPGSGMAGGGQAGIPGSASAAMQFFQSRGWTPAQAAGLAANLQVESNFSPSAVGDGGRAYGIAQWHPDRQRNFQAWSGRDIRGSTFEQQLEFMHYEMTQGTERRAGSMIRQATTPEQAAAFVDQYYERSNGHARARRMQLAASYASGAPAAPGQFANNPASSAPVLAQASTDRIQADREQIRNTHRMLREFNQQSNISNEQLRQQEATRIAEKKEMASGDVSLRTRILSVFNQLAQAS